MSVFASEVANGLLGVGRAVDELFNDRAADPLPIAGSEAAQERETSYGSSDGGTDLTLGIVWVTLGIPSDHLQAAHRLILNPSGDAGVHRYAVLSCLRVVLEVASIAWWLTERGIGAPKRLERTLTFAQHSVSLRERAERVRTEPNDLSYLTAIQETIDRVTVEHDLRRLTGEKKRRIPDATQLIGDQFEALGGHRGDAISIYGLLSEFTHGNFLGAMLGYTRDAKGTPVLRPRVPLGEVGIAANYASVGLSLTVEQFIGFMGWDVEAWRKGTQPHLSAIEAVAEATKDID